MRRLRPKEVNWPGQEGLSLSNSRPALFLPSQLTHCKILQRHSPHLHLPLSLSLSLTGGSLSTPGCLCQCGWVSVASRAYSNIVHHLPLLSIRARNSRGCQVATASIKSALTSSHIPKHVPQWHKEHLNASPSFPVETENLFSASPTLQSSALHYVCL